MTQDEIETLASDVSDMQESLSDLIKGTMQLFIGSLIIGILSDPLHHMVQCVKIENLKDKMAQKRKRMKPRGYVMYSVKRSCIGVER